MKSIPTPGNCQIMTIRPSLKQNIKKRNITIHEIIWGHGEPQIGGLKKQTYLSSNKFG